MSSIFDCGCTEFIPISPDPDAFKGNEFRPGRPYSYPFDIPKVYLDGVDEIYYPQTLLSWSADSVVVAHKNSLIIYTQRCYCELLAEDEAGNVVWLDARTAPSDYCWEGKYRGALTYDIEEFHLDTLEKLRYKVTLDSTSPISADDLKYIKKYIDPTTYSTAASAVDSVATAAASAADPVATAADSTPIPDAVLESIFGDSPF